MIFGRHGKRHVLPHGVRHADGFDRSLSEVRRVLRDIDDRLARLRRDTSAFQREIEQGVDPIDAARKYRDIWGIWPEALKRKGRPRRRFDGGDPVPVEPKPKPKPLLDGAEAPIE